MPRASINILVLRCREFSTIWKPPSFSCCALQQSWCIGIFRHLWSFSVVWGFSQKTNMHHIYPVHWLGLGPLSCWTWRVIWEVELSWHFEPTFDLAELRFTAVMNFRKLYFVGHCTPCMDPRLDSEPSFFHIGVWTDVVCVQKVSSRYGAMVFEKMPDWYQIKKMTQQLIPNCHHENQRMFLLPYTVLKV